MEPDAPQGSRRAGPYRPPARHAPRIPPRSRHCGRGRPPCPGASRRRARAGPLRPKCTSAARHQPCPSRRQPRGGGPPASGARTARPAVEQVATDTARGCRERAAYGSSASASRPRVQLKARHAGCEVGHAKPLRVHCSGLGAPAQPPRRASLQRRRLPARRSMPWQCGRSAALRSSRAGRRPALGHLRARSLPPGRTTTTTATKAKTPRRRPTREAAKGRKQLELRRRPAATRRRGDRMGSAISETSRSGPQAVKDARSARLAEPIP